jgi:hypothetical protein
MATHGALGAHENGLELDVTGKRLGPKGVRELGRTLCAEGPNGLTFLNLTRNNLGPNGAQALAEALKV